MDLKANLNGRGTRLSRAGFNPRLSADPLLTKDFGRVKLGGGFISLPETSMHRVKTESASTLGPSPSRPAAGCK